MNWVMIIFKMRIQNHTISVILILERRKTLTEKGEQYRFHTHESVVTLKEDLQQLNDVFKLINKINQEMTELDDNYMEGMWFSDIDDKIFTFKHRIHNWLREGEKLVKLERKSKSLRKTSKSSGSKFSESNSSPSFRSSNPSARGKAIQEKVRVAELQTGPSFMKKKRDAEWQAELLRLEEDMAKARARKMVWNPVLCISGFSSKLRFSQCFGHVMNVSAKIINNGRQ